MLQAHFVASLRAYICTPLFHDTDPMKQRRETAHQSELFAHQRASVLPPALLPPYTDVPSCSRSPDTPGPFPLSFSLSLSNTLSSFLPSHCMPRDPTRSLKASFRAKLYNRYLCHAEQLFNFYYNFVVRIVHLRRITTRNYVYKLLEAQ